MLKYTTGVAANVLGQGDGKVTRRSFENEYKHHVNFSIEYLLYRRAIQISKTSILLPSVAHDCSGIRTSPIGATGAWLVYPFTVGRYNMYRVLYIPWKEAVN